MKKYIALFCALILSLGMSVQASPNSAWLTYANNYAYAMGGGHPST